MAEAANDKPVIRIHLDQQVNIDAVRGGEEIEDAAVLTEITGFYEEDEAYVLKGALTITGFLRRGEESGDEELPDEFDDRDVFDTAEEATEGDVISVHERLPFVLQVPVAAQQEYQREAGILDVNPKVGQWNLYVLGDQTVHFRAELAVQGLSAQEGYVFRCGSQEEGVQAPASKLDHLLDQEESRAYVPPAADETQEFEPPFENEWSAEQEAALRGTESEEARAADETQEQEDDWVIETPQFDAYAPDAPEAREEQESGEEDDIIFTPDPGLVFPMPEPGTEWAQQLEEADRSFGEQTNTYNSYYPPVAPFANQQGTPPQRANEWPQAEEYEYLHRYQQQSHTNAQPYSQVEDDGQMGHYQPPEAHEPAQRYEFAEQQDQADDEEAFVLEDTRSEADSTEQVIVEEQADIEAPVFADRKEPTAPVAPVTPPAPAPAPEPQAVEEAPPVAVEQTEVIVEQTETEILMQETEHHEHQDQHESHHHDHDDHDDHNNHGDHDPDIPPQLEAEYDFEDEVSRTEAVPPIQMVEEPAQKASGPKISFGGGKNNTAYEDSPIKLSSLLGDSRAAAQPAEEAPFTDEAQLARESSSSSKTAGDVFEAAHESHTAPMLYESGAYDHADTADGIAPAPISANVTNSNDSAWSAFLTRTDTRATMKFRIVQEEDNLADLAEAYRTSVSDLARANNLSGQEVDPGQILYIPIRNR